MNIFKTLNLDFTSLKSSITDYLSTKFSEFDLKYTDSTIFGQLITVITSITQNLLLYIEDAFTEQNKFTATRKKSIYGLAQLTGYNPSLGKAAGMQITLSYKPNNYNSEDVIINNHQQITCQQNGLNYNIILSQDAIILNPSKDNSNKYLYAVEGQFESQSFVSTGGPLYMEHVQTTGDIDEYYTEVYVNNEKWERAESLYDMEPGAKQWFYKTSVINGIVIGFGTNEHGRALKNGDVISVVYLSHVGEMGNLNTKENITFTFEKLLSTTNGDTIDGNAMFDIKLTNIDSVTSGTNAEDIDQVKQMIGYNSRSLVLAAPENYKTFINKFSFCGYNRTWSEPGSLLVKSLIMKNFKTKLVNWSDYFSLNEKDFFLTRQQKESIINNITNSGNQLLGTTYKIIDPTLSKYALYIYLKMKNNSYNKSYIEAQIRSLIGMFFANIQQDDYIPKSDIAQLIKNNISDVDGVNCYFISEANETALINMSYKEQITVFDPSVNTFVTKEHTVRLYDGEDPGLGLDAHGNIYLSDPSTFPVLMGGWRYINSDNQNQEIDVVDPLTIIFE